MTRLEALQDRSQNHTLYKRLARKLTEAEFDQVVAFIEDNDSLGHLEFEFKATRLFIDGDKPKNASIMIELLHVANFAAKGGKSK